MFTIKLKFASTGDASYCCNCLQENPDFNILNYAIEWQDNNVIIKSKLIRYINESIMTFINDETCLNISIDKN